MRIPRGESLPAPPRRLGRMARTAWRALARCALWVAALGLLAPAPAGAWELGLGRSNRPGDFDLSLRDRCWVVEYVDEGRQPQGIPNINRVLDLDLLLRGGARLSWYLEGGLSNARWSRNGSGDGYQAPRGFEGGNLGGGLQWRAAPGWWLRLHALWLHYPQSSQPGSETFEYSSAALVRRW